MGGVSQQAHVSVLAAEGNCGEILFEDIEVHPSNVLRIRGATVNGEPSGSAGFDTYFSASHLALDGIPVAKRHGDEFCEIHACEELKICGNKTQKLTPDNTRSSANPILPD